MKFPEMPYARPDIEAVKKDIRTITDKLKSAATFQQADAALLEMDECLRHTETLSTLAHIRHDIDTNDEFYKDEQAFWDTVGPELQEYHQEFDDALFNSPFRAEFSEKYSPLLFTNTEISLRTFKPELIGDLKRENELTTEYDNLIASAQIPFEGGVYTLSQMSPFKQSPDDKRRLAAWTAEGNFYSGIGDKLDSIYDELVALRTSMGRKLGYENYIPLGYDRMMRNCYTKEDVEKFRESVIKYMVPVADKIYREQAKRLGVAYPLSYSDAALEYRSGNAAPKGTPEDILAHGKKFYHELSPETAEFIDVMFENQCMDVLSKKGKAGGGYCTSIPDYSVPFIFANFNGTSHDVEVMTHEAGHAFQAYTCRNIKPISMQWASLESCEIHSMSMEFFAWPWEEGFFHEDTQKFYYSHLTGALTFIPYGTMVDHFQHIVYEHPELTPGQRHQEWSKLMSIYMPWIRLDGEIPFYSFGRYWQRQSHIYDCPFYYIDYCLAQTMSLQFWEYMLRDRKAAWEAYMRLVRPGGTMTFRQLVEAAGLVVPFQPNALKDVCAAAEKWIADFDMSQLA